MAEWVGAPNYYVLPKKSKTSMKPGEYAIGFVADNPKCFYFAADVADAVNFAKGRTLMIALCRNQDELEQLRIALGDAPAHS